MIPCLSVFGDDSMSADFCGGAALAEHKGLRDGSARSPRGRRKAILFGNTYRTSRNGGVLPMCHRDVSHMAVALRLAGFVVTRAQIRYEYAAPSPD